MNMIYTYPDFKMMTKGLPKRNWQNTGHFVDIFTLQKNNISPENMPSQ